MQIASQKFKEFKYQCHSQNDMVKVQDLNKQISRLQLIKNNKFSTLAPSEKQAVDKHIKTYRLAVKQIQRMKMQFTKPSLVKRRLTQIFDNQQNQIGLQHVSQKQQSIRSSQIQIPSFKQTNFKTKKENVIDQNKYDDNDGKYSPTLKKFFQKKQTQIMNRTGGSANFKSLINAQQNVSFTNRSNNQNRSVSRQQPSRVSGSSASSFKRKPNPQAQLRKVLQQNKKIKQQYDRRLKRQLELNQFQKNLLKQEKNRYMMKIQQLQSQMERLYRDNYKLKQQQVILKQKQKKQALKFDNSASFRDVDQNVHGNQGNSNDFYQPYVMKTKHNDLKKLNMINHQLQGNSSALNKSIQNFFQQNSAQNKNSSDSKNPYKKQNPNIDILGNQLEKYLKQIQNQRSRSNNSQRSSNKKWSKDYNGHISQISNNSKKQNSNDIFKALSAQDQQQQRLRKEVQNNKSPFFGNSQQKNIKNNKFTQMSQKNPFQKKSNFNGDNDNMILKELGIEDQLENQNNFRSSQKPQINVLGPQSYVSPQSSRISAKTLPNQVAYKPNTNYSFTRTQNRDYYLNNSNAQNYDTFQMTRTYLNMTQNDQESQTNKYIDSKTSTRNKVAFFKQSLILIKNQTFQLAFKRSNLVNTKDRVRVIFFLKNKTYNNLKVNFNYEYDASYFKLKINEKIFEVPANGQARQDLQIYAFSSSDLNEVIDILVEVNQVKYGLWMPITWIQFQQSPHFNMPNYNQQITIVPDRQFKSYDTAKSMIPLLFGGIQGLKEWAYLYGISKFGPCFIKLIWENKQLTIQTNAKWIDLLAFILHHVK